MPQEYRTLRVAPAGEGVLSVVMDVPPMNLIGPELVRDLVSLPGGLLLACGMRFAAGDNAVLGQIEVGAGALPGAGGVQHLGRRPGRGRAMEPILGADDVDAETAKRYGWINRALPDAGLDAFVARLARRIASFPVDGVRTAKRVLNELTRPAEDAIRADAVQFRQLVTSGPAQDGTAPLFALALQTRGPLELNLGERLAELDPSP